MRDKDIVRVYLEDGKVVCLIKTDEPPYYCRPRVYEGKEARRFLLWYKQAICSREDPEERWEHFEVVNKYGVYDYEKHERLLASRTNKALGRPPSEIEILLEAYEKKKNELIEKGVICDKD